MRRSIIAALLGSVALSSSYASAADTSSSTQPTTCSTKTTVEVAIKDAFGKKINYGSYASGGMELTQEAIKNLSSQKGPLPVAIYNISPQGKLENFRSIGIAAFSDSKVLSVQLKKDISIEEVKKTLFSSDPSEKTALLVTAPLFQQEQGNLENISSFEVDTLQGKTPIMDVLSSLEGSSVQKIKEATMNAPRGNMISFARIEGFSSSILTTCSCSSYWNYACCSGSCYNGSPIGWPANCQGSCSFSPSSGCTEWSTWCACRS